MVKLYEHNLEAFLEINKMIESGTKKIAAPRATGSGKTYLMGALAEKYNDEPKLVLEPTRPLLDSIKEKFDEFGIANMNFMTYQKLIRMSDEDIVKKDYKLIFLDECHHGTSPVWGKKIDCLITTHPDSIIFGTSATTVRNDGVNVVETIFEGNTIGELPLSTAIARKVLPCPHYITAIYRLDDEFEKLKKRIDASTNTKAEKKEFLKKIRTMQSNFEKSYGVPTILNKYIKVKNGKYLVFCKDKKHLDTMRDVVIDWFRTAGLKDVHSYAIYSDYPDKEKDYKDFQKDNSEALKLLFSINMLNEGLHIEDISGVLMLRTTQSNLVYLQQLGRLLEAGNMGKYLLVFDFVNNFSSVNEGIGLLKEIKDAIEREKESDPNFDDSGFEDIDTFFVLENMIQIQEMFKEIEERLQGSWDLYIKALKQYKEREGDCLVPDNHVEIVDAKKIGLGNWCGTIRGYGNSGLAKEKETQLNQIGFVWDVHNYIFKNKIKKISEYYSKYGKYPSSNIEDSEIRKLGNFINDEKIKMREENYPNWKIEIIQKYLPNFSCKTRTEKSLDSFIYFVNLYKERYGHVDIKRLDTIDDFPIGIRLQTLRAMYKDGKLSESIIFRLENMGVYLKDKRKRQFNEKMELVRQAVFKGVVISKSNPSYKYENIYQWLKEKVYRKYKNNELSDGEIDIIEQLIKQPLVKFYTNSNFVQINDVINNKVTVCKSQSEAVRIIQEEFNLKISWGTVARHLNGQVTTPYKGRFMFYYATEEEIKKYMEENKVVNL